MKTKSSWKARIAKIYCNLPDSYTIKYEGSGDTWEAHLHNHDELVCCIGDFEMTTDGGYIYGYNDLSPSDSALIKGYNINLPKSRYE